MTTLNVFVMMVMLMLTMARKERDASVNAALTMSALMMAMAANVPPLSTLDTADVNALMDMPLLADMTAHLPVILPPLTPVPHISSRSLTASATSTDVS